ncbi:hypothetical protein BROUX41_002018 [Berkeleyomyces rouxiae]|uniref:uncharacterized protein n=1 Tax=Berkeleyomyces rouxiae TaxID=2035830 RepID=UPI003B7BB343
MSSREQYQIPSGSGAAVGSGSTKFEGPVKLNYICGDCGLNSTQHQTVPFLRCKECGCRILYKPRTKRMVQFEAR